MSPLEVQVLQQTSSSIRLAWSAIAGTAVYKVTALNAAQRSSAVLYWGATPNCRIAGLEANFCYTCQVHAMRVDAQTGGYVAHRSSAPVPVNTLAPPPSALSMHRAIRNAHEYALKRIVAVRADLLAVPGPNGLLPLHTAVLAGSKDLVDLLLRCGADVNGACPLSGRTALQLALLAGHAAIGKALAERRADLRARDCVGECAAAYAVDGGHGAGMQLMLELYADVLREPAAAGGCSVDALLRRAIVMRIEAEVVGALLSHAKGAGLAVDWEAALGLAEASGQTGLASVVRAWRPEDQGHVAPDA